MHWTICSHSNTTFYPQVHIQKSWCVWVEPWTSLARPHRETCTSGKREEEIQDALQNELEDWESGMIPEDRDESMYNLDPNTEQNNPRDGNGASKDGISDRHQSIVPHVWSSPSTSGRDDDCNDPLKAQGVLQDRSETRLTMGNNDDNAISGWIEGGPLMNISLND